MCMSGMRTWQESAFRSVPSVQIWMSCTSCTPSIAQQGARHFFQGNIARQAFQQNVPAFAQDACARPQNHRADGDADHRVSPSGAGVADGQRSDDESRRSKARRPDCESRPCAHSGRAGRVDSASVMPPLISQREHRNPQHQPGMHLHRGAQPQHRFVDQNERRRASAAWRSQTPPEFRRDDSRRFFPAWAGAAPSAWPARKSPASARR